MEAATTGARTQTGSLRMRLALAAAAACLAGQAAALDETATAAMGAAAPAERPTQIELRATQWPRLDMLQPPPGARLDLSLLPDRPSAVGLTLGMSGFNPAQPMGSPTGPAWNAVAQPAFDVGLHWRHTLSSDYRLDITAWRRMSSPVHDLALGTSHEPTYGARVELNLKPARKTGLVADLRFIGVQLQGGGRITVKRKNGRPMVYYRTSF